MFGRDTTARCRAKEFMDCATNRVELDPRAYFQMSADNLQWKDHGKYVHYFTNLYWPMSEDNLLNEGILNDNSVEEGVEGSGRLSRSPKLDWAHFVTLNKKDTVLKQVFSPTDDEFGMLGECILSHITTILKVLPDLPSIQESKQMKEEKRYKWDKLIPFIFRLSKQGEIDTLVASKNLELPDAPIMMARASIMAQNNLKPSLPCKMNFSSKESNYGILDHMIRVADDQVERFNENSDDKERDRPISEDVITFAGDGGPIAMMKNIMTSDPDRRYDRVKLLIGVFHFWSETFKKSNQLQEEIVIWLIDSFVGKSEVKRQMYMNPNDPTIPENQMSSVILAILTYTIFVMKDEGLETASAVQVWDFLRGRAKNCTAVNAILVLLQSYETCVLIRRSERNSDLDCFQSCMKLCMPIFSGTHATQYMKMGSDQLQDFATMSELEEKLYRARGFTGTTENGEKAGVDWIHEKYNFAIKNITGKNWKVGFDTKIENATMTVLQDSEDLKNANKKISNSDFITNRIEHWTTDAETYVSVVTLLHQSDVLRNNGIIIKGKRCDTKSALVSPVDERPISSDTLRYQTFLVPRAND
jgi:hypothetical protein